MNDRPERGQADPAWGLCATCRHVRVIASDRGARFAMCDLSRTDARYPRYPPLPVRRCAGHEPRPRTED